MRCSLTVREASTGVEFPLVRTFWEGEAQRSMGASVRQKKIAFLGVKVYAVALYVEAERAAKELGVRKRGGFFDDNRNEDYALALVDGAFAKALEIQLVRKVEGAQFADAIAEALEPRMRLTGEMATLDKFKQFFDGRTLEKGTQIVLLWRVEGILEMTVRTAEDGTDYTRATPDLRIESPGMCRALFEVYLGSNTVVPDAIHVWAEGTKQLLDSEEVKRATRRGGSG